MTLEALKELRERVAAGEWPISMGALRSPPRNFMDLANAIFPCPDEFFNKRTRSAWAAYLGSLDAAQALHEAVLPGMSQFSIVTDPTCLCVKVCWWPDGLSVGRQIVGEGWHESSPARAWLIAILSALIATEGGGVIR